jgi:hypothetical protein
VVDYDYEWKLLLENHFEQAIAFFLPKIYNLIDFSVAPIFLEQEIQDTIGKMVEGKRQKRKYADKLAKVRFKDGTDKWVLIHIEIQSTFQTSFSRRMFDYYYWISAKYDDPDIIALAIYTGSRVSKEHNRYQKKFHGTELTYKFNIYEVRKQDEAELLRSDNPFALVVLASLYVLKSKKDVNSRFQYKRKLVELTRAKGYTHAEIIGLLRFIRYIVSVPPNLTLELDIEIANHYLKNYSGMTIPSKQDEKFVNDIYKAVMGVSVEDIKLQVKKAEQKQRRMEQAQLRLEQKRLQAEQEKRQAEQEKFKLEEEKRQIEKEKFQAEQGKFQAEQGKFQAEQEKFQAEQGKFQAEQEKLFAIRKLILLKILSNEQIAEIQSVSIEEVKRIKEELEN